MDASANDRRQDGRAGLLVAAAIIMISACRKPEKEAGMAPPSATAIQSMPATAPTTTARPPESARWWDGASDCVYDEWRVHGSGYALLEILERHVIDDRWDGHKVKPGITAARVIELLGEPACRGSENREDCYPNYGPGDWLYNGSRFAMPNDYWHFHFDAEGVLQSLDWSGE